MVKPGQNMNGLKWDIVIFWQLYTNTVRMALNKGKYKSTKFEIILTWIHFNLQHNYSCNMDSFSPLSSN